MDKFIINTIQPADTTDYTVPLIVEQSIETEYLMPAVLNDKYAPLLVNGNITYHVFSVPEYSEHPFMVKYDVYYVYLYYMTTLGGFVSVKYGRTESDICNKRAMTVFEYDESIQPDWNGVQVFFDNLPKTISIKNNQYKFSIRANSANHVNHV